MAGGLLDMLRGLGGNGQPQQQTPTQPAGAPSGGIMGAASAPPAPGRFDGLMPVLNDIFTGMAMGTNNNDAIGKAALMLNQGSKSRAAKGDQNKTVAWLKKQGLGADEASYLASDPDAMRAWYKQKSAGDNPEWKIQRLFNNDGVEQDFMVDLKNPTRMQPIGGAKKGGAEDGDEWGLNPVYGQDKDGKTVLGVTSKSGKFKQLDAPEGFSVSSGVEKIDMGTQWGLYDKRTGGIVGYQPKDVVGEASQKAVGTASGEATAALPAKRLLVERTEKLVDSIANDPKIDSYLGSVQGRLPSTSQGAIDFDSKLEQLKGNAFLDARQLLKGGGAITDFESNKAESAMARLQTVQSEPAFKAALKDFRDAVTEGARKLEEVSAMGEGATSPQSPAQGAAVPFTEYFK